jgi:heavy metal sensor kinase
MMPRLTIRWRMTLWYGAVLAIVLVSFSAALYLTMRQHLAARADRELSDELVEVRQEIEEANSLSELQQRLHRRFDNDASIDFEVRGSSGDTIFRSKRLGSQSLPLTPKSASAKAPDFSSAQIGEMGQWRIASQTAAGTDGTYLMQVGRSLVPEQDSLRELLHVLLLIVPLALIAAIGGGYWLAKRALAPVDRMTREAEAITASQLNLRLPVNGHDDELERLALTLNRMIERLQRSFEEMQQFTADAAHELRTPLAIMHSAAEVALRSAREPEQYRSVLENLMEETDQLTRLASQLLYLCREDSGQNPPPVTCVRLDKLVCDVCDQMQIVAEEQALSLTVSADGACEVSGDAERLRRVLFNLIDNAVKYTDSGGSISVSVTSDDRLAHIVVSDTGIGIASQHIPHIFQRFYRPPGATDTRRAGTGLGLAICKAIVESHAGRIDVRSEPGKSSEFTITLPVKRSCLPVSSFQG